MLVPHVFLTRQTPEKTSLDFARDLLEKLLPIPFSVYVDEQGKPLVDSDIPIAVSISHSDGFLAFAVFLAEKIGIDIEKREMNYPRRVADRFFSASERKKIKTANDFFDIWTKKEAFVKMTGDGISHISSFDSENDNKNVFIKSYSDKVSEILGEKFSFAIACNKDFQDPEFIFI